MAVTKAQKECEEWITENWLKEKYGIPFNEMKVIMQGKGNFKFDAVDESEQIIANISTASIKTCSGNLGAGKKNKLRADCLMLCLAKAKKKLLILTEECMYEFAKKEQNDGRLPLDIEIVHVQLPEELRNKLKSAKDSASNELIIMN